MKRPAQILFVFLTCLQLCGGAQGLMQCVAWAKMLASYSQDRNLSEAVEMTFDGEHPCPLCLAIQESERQEHEQQQPDQAPETKALKFFKDLPLLSAAGLPVRIDTHEECGKPGAVRVRCGLLAYAPPVPPPRA